MALVEIDDYYPYSYQPLSRYGYGKPPHQLLEKMFSINLVRYENLLKEFVMFASNLKAIPNKPDVANESLPCWDNGWLPAMDGIALYGMVSSVKPLRYFEIGSGNSTKFVALAKKHSSPQTTIVSIDPAPRAVIDQLCDYVIRDSLQNVSASFFSQLEPGDILFIDGSHRVLQNSDVAVFYMEILPLLKPGVIIGQHDIVLPYDYHTEWAKRMYSEQYMLAAVLLAAEEKYDIILPLLYIVEMQRHLLCPLFDSIWTSPNLCGIPLYGSSFWMTKTNHPFCP